MEVAYEALENGTCRISKPTSGLAVTDEVIGGITVERIAGTKTAVCISVFSDDYSNMLLSDPESLPLHHVTGTGKAIFANRISYYFDLKGPSFTLDTGCSGSLVALHQACQSIRSGESEQAIVGGTNLLLSPKTSMSLGNFGYDLPSTSAPKSVLKLCQDFSRVKADVIHLTVEEMDMGGEKGSQVLSSSLLKMLWPPVILYVL